MNNAIQASMGLAALRRGGFIAQDRVGDTSDGAVVDNTPIATHDKGFMSIVTQAAQAAGAAVPPFIHRQMSAGMVGDDVSEWQGMLGIPQTGVYDSATVAATKAFQKSHGLFVDGVAGKDTIGAMFGANAALPPASTPTVPDPPPNITPPAAPVLPPPVTAKKALPWWKIGLGAVAAGAVVVAADPKILKTKGK